jgi:hypothetical protein
MLRMETISLLTGIGCVGIGRVALHAVVHDVRRVRDGITPEGLRIDPEITHNRILCVRKCKGNWSAVTVFTSPGGEIVPPRLHNTEPTKNLRIDMVIVLTWPFPSIPPCQWASTMKSLPVMTNHEA